MTFQFSGIAASMGIAIGRAVVHVSAARDIARYLIDLDQIEVQLQRLHEARMQVLADLNAIKNSFKSSTSLEIEAMIEVHCMLLQDEVFSDEVARWVREHRYNAEWALSTQFEVLTRRFAVMEDEYLRERIYDIEQLAERMLNALQGKDVVQPFIPTVANKHTQEESDNEGWILIAKDISPAEMMHFNVNLFKGLVTTRGGTNSHTAIVARSLELPTVVAVPDIANLVEAEEWVIVDGSTGVVLLSPDTEVLASYRKRLEQNEFAKETRKRLIGISSQTKDKVPIRLLANADKPSEFEAAYQAGALGVGLFRTEYLFMRRSTLPDESEQFQAYSQAVKAMHGLPITIRTIDVGYDKPLNISMGNQGSDLVDSSPLGQRAIRFSLAYPDLFQTQLRAILRASRYGKVRLLLPLITHISEIDASKKALEQARQSLRDDHHVYANVSIGAMIEVPAAAVAITWLLPELDFIAIGTNDLMQYLLAIDRTDDRVGNLYNPTHPAFLALIFHVIRSAKAANKPVSMCGELAGDQRYTRLLLGAGLEEFSMQPSQLLLVKEALLDADTHVLKTQFQQLLQTQKQGEREKILETFGCPT